MEKKSVLFYRIASATLILFACVHLIGHFSDPADTLDAEGLTLWRSMESYHIAILGVERSFIDFLTGYSWYLFVFTLFLGFQNLVIVNRNQTRPDFVRTMTILNLGMIGILAILTLKYFILPPFILFAVSWVFFLLSLVTNKSVEAG